MYQRNLFFVIPAFAGLTAVFRKNIGYSILGIGIFLGLSSAAFAQSAGPQSELITQDIANLATAPAGPSAIPAGGTAIGEAQVSLLQQAENNVINNQQAGIHFGLYTVAPAYQQSLAQKIASSFSSFQDPFSQLILIHVSNFCSPGVSSESAFGGSNCPSDSLLQDADISIANLLNVTSYASSSDQYNAALQFTQNMIMPSPGYGISFPTDSDMAKNSLQNAQNFTQPYAKALADQAILSVARQSLVESIAKRTLPTDSKAGTQSIMQMIAQEAFRRFLNPTWSNNMNSMVPKSVSQLGKSGASAPKTEETTAGVLIEISKQLAFQNYMEYERYRQGERIEALLAAIVAQNNQQGKASAALLSQQTSAPSIGVPTQ